MSHAPPTNEQPAASGKSPPPERIEQLDAVRGLASLTVVVHHHLLMLPAVRNEYEFQSGGFPVSLLFVPPLHLLHAGHAAVMMFFVLSGYVLTLPFLQGRQPAYGRYFLKRVCRIYVPYAAAVAGAMVAAGFLYSGDIPELSDWFRRNWRTPVGGRDLAEHAALVWTEPTGRFNNVIWSLVHEMRVSIVFPLIAVMVIRLRWWQSLLAAVGLSVIGVYGFESHWRLWTLREYGTTMHYAAFFVVGAVLAKHRHTLDRLVRSLPAAGLVAWVGAGVAFYLADGWHPAARGEWIHEVEWLTTIGAALLLVYAASAEWLRVGPLVWLGRVSYSLYLWHVPVLLAVVHVGYGSLPVWALLIISFSLSLLVAQVMYRLVEEPAIRLAKAAGGRKK